MYEPHEVILTGHSGLHFLSSTISNFLQNSTHTVSHRNPEWHITNAMTNRYIQGRIWWGFRGSSCCSFCWGTNPINMHMVKTQILASCPKNFGSNTPLDTSDQRTLLCSPEIDWVETQQNSGKNMGLFRKHYCTFLVKCPEEKGKRRIELWWVHHTRAIWRLFYPSFVSTKL